MKSYVEITRAPGVEFIRYTVEAGNDGHMYAVFCDSTQLETAQAEGHFADRPIACFDQYENAIQLTDEPWVK